MTQKITECPIQVTFILNRYGFILFLNMSNPIFSSIILYQYTIIHQIYPNTPIYHVPEYTKYVGQRIITLGRTYIRSLLSRNKLLGQIFVILRQDQDKWIPDNMLENATFVAGMADH